MVARSKSQLGNVPNLEELKAHVVQAEYQSILQPKLPGPLARLMNIGVSVKERILAILETPQYKKNIIRDDVLGKIKSVAGIAPNDFAVAGDVTKLFTSSGKILLENDDEFFQLRNRKLIMVSDGQIAGAGNDDVIRVWNLTGQMLQEIPTHREAPYVHMALEEGIRDMVFLPEESVFVVANTDGILQFRDRKGKKSWELQPFQGDRKKYLDLFSLQALGEGKVLVSGIRGNSVVDFPHRTQKNFGTRGNVVLFQQFNSQLPDGEIVTATSKKIEIWNQENLVKIAEFSTVGNNQHLGHADSVSALTVNSNGDIITGSKDGSLIFWTTEGEAKTILFDRERKLNSSHQEITTVTVLPDQSIISTKYSQIQHFSLPKNSSGANVVDIPIKRPLT